MLDDVHASIPGKGVSGLSVCPPEFTPQLEVKVAEDVRAPHDVLREDVLPSGLSGFEEKAEGVWDERLVVDTDPLPEHIHEAWELRWPGCGSAGRALPSILRGGLRDAPALDRRLCGPMAPLLKGSLGLCLGGSCPVWTVQEPPPHSCESKWLLF